MLKKLVIGIEEAKNEQYFRWSTQIADTHVAVWHAQSWWVWRRFLIPLINISSRNADDLLFHQTLKMKGMLYFTYPSFIILDLIGRLSQNLCKEAKRS